MEFRFDFRKIFFALKIKLSAKLILPGCTGNASFRFQGDWKVIEKKSHPLEWMKEIISGGCCDKNKCICLERRLFI